LASSISLTHLAKQFDLNGEVETVLAQDYLGVSTEFGENNTLRKFFD
jgi:hypothetical protein